MTIRHCCETHGCYVKTQTPDWGFLDSSFSNKIRVGDIDGIVEANGRLLILEWKSFIGDIPVGQRIMFEKITALSQIIVFVISGDPVESVPEHISIYSNGSVVADEDCDKEKLRKYCTAWETKSRRTDQTARPFKDIVTEDKSAFSDNMLQQMADNPRYPLCHPDDKQAADDYFNSGRS